MLEHKLLHITKMEIAKAFRLNLQFGISRRLSHAPIVLSAALQNLNNWDLSTPEEEVEFSLETVYEKEESFGKQFMRHLVLGVEILPHENFILRAGYNYQVRQELKFDEKRIHRWFFCRFWAKTKTFPS